MPAPAVYVLAVVGTVAAGLAFKEFVYEPHIAPKIERWAEEFLAKRRERKRQREAMVAVSPSFGYGHTNKRSDDGHDDDDDKSAFELEKLVSHVSEEVREWRNEVDRSQSSTLRQRHAATRQFALDQSNISLPYVPMTPTHIIFDSAATPTPTVASRLPSPVRRSASRETLRSPPPGRLPTPDTSVHSASPAVDPSLFSPSSIPSLSLSHPVDLDHEHGVELLSAPSSRPDSPFSAVSHTLTDDYQSFSASASEAGTDADESDDVISVQSSTAPSVISDFDDLHSNFGSEASWASATPHSP